MLTLRKKLFIDNYKIHKNASKAAKLAGYSSKSAGETGQRLLRDKDVSGLISQWESEESSRLSNIRSRITQEVFEAEAWKNYEAEVKSELRIKWLDLFGRVRGFFNSELNNLQVNLLAIISAELNVAPPAASAGQPVINVSPSSASIEKKVSPGTEAGTLPQGGLEKYINPLPKSPQLLNHVNRESKGSSEEMSETLQGPPVVHLPQPENMLGATLNEQKVVVKAPKPKKELSPENLQRLRDLAAKARAARAAKAEARKAELLSQGGPI